MKNFQYYHDRLNSLPSAQMLKRDTYTTLTGKPRHKTEFYYRYERNDGTTGSRNSPIRNSYWYEFGTEKQRLGLPLSDLKYTYISIPTPIAGIDYNAYYHIEFNPTGVSMRIVFSSITEGENKMSLYTDNQMTIDLGKQHPRSTMADVDSIAKMYLWKMANKVFCNTARYLKIQLLCRTSKESLLYSLKKNPLWIVNSLCSIGYKEKYQEDALLKRLRKMGHIIEDYSNYRELKRYYLSAGWRKTPIKTNVWSFADIMSACDQFDDDDEIFEAAETMIYGGAFAEPS